MVMIKGKTDEEMRKLYNKLSKEDLIDMLVSNKGQGEKSPIGTITVGMRARIHGYNKSLRRVRRLRVLLTEVDYLHRKIEKDPITINIEKK